MTSQNHTLGTFSDELINCAEPGTGLTCWKPGSGRELRREAERKEERELRRLTKTRVKSNKGFA